MKFDFDVAHDAAPTFHQLQEDVKKVAANHRVTITKVIEHGPGGGNPNFLAECESHRQACEFLVDLYRDPSNSHLLYGLRFDTREEMIQEIASAYGLVPEPPSPGTVVARKKLNGSSSLALILPKKILTAWGWDAESYIDIVANPDRSFTIKKA